MFRREKKKRRTRKKRACINKKNVLNQNTINLTNVELSQHHQSLLKKSPSFMPTTKDVNWFNLRQDFDKFKNQLRITFNQAIDKSNVKNTNVNTNNSNNNIKDNNDNNEPVPKKKHKSNNLYISKETKINIKKGKESKALERKALAELKSAKNTVVRIQNKGSRFVVLTNEDCEKKVAYQIARSSFKVLKNNPSQEN